MTRIERSRAKLNVCMGQTNLKSRTTLTFCIWVVTQWAFTAICASWVWLKFVGQFLRYLAERFFVWSTRYFGPVWHWPLTSWPPKLIVSCPCPVDHLCQFAGKLVHSRSQVWRETNRQTENVMSPTASLAWPQSLWVCQHTVVYVWMTIGQGCTTCRDPVSFCQNELILAQKWLVVRTCY